MTQLDNSNANVIDNQWNNVSYHMYIHKYDDIVKGTFMTFMKPFKHSITNLIYWAPKNHMRFITSQSNA